MSVFGRKNEDDTSAPTYVTHAEAQSALSAYITKEDAQELRNQVNGLVTRVGDLERLARTLRSGGVAHNTVTPEEVLQRSNPATQTATATGVDYGAIAFGLSEIKRAIKYQFDVTDAQMRDQFAGTVQYFADVFAKSDPGFDEALFKQQSGA